MSYMKQNNLIPVSLVKSHNSFFDLYIKLYLNIRLKIAYYPPHNIRQYFSSTVCPIMPKNDFYNTKSHSTCNPLNIPQ